MSNAPCTPWSARHRLPQIVWAVGIFSAVTLLRIVSIPRQVVIAQRRHELVAEDCLFLVQHLLQIAGLSKRGQHGQMEPYLETGAMARQSPIMP
ncbi:MAG TPA: hypothetical protein VFR84_07980 [Candidatus Angelobacter sp.]|nr:hypothetical protein [Candidatus Angelobacter sp.]